MGSRGTATTDTKALTENETVKRAAARAHCYSPTSEKGPMFKHAAGWTALGAKSVPGADPSVGTSQCPSANGCWGHGTLHTEGVGALSAQVQQYNKSGKYFESISLEAGTCPCLKPALPQMPADGRARHGVRPLTSHAEGG